MRLGFISDTKNNQAPKNNTPSRLAIVAAGLFVLFSPVLTIWSLNNIFRLGLAYSLESWLSVFWLIMLVMLLRSRS